MADANFLESLYPGGPWLINPIVLDGNLGGRKVLGKTCHTVEEVNEYCENFPVPANFYYSVNRVLGNLDGRASRQSISEVHYLHVDIDPVKGADPEAEKARILAILNNPPAGVPGKPTIIVASGGGYNALWKLDTPFITNGRWDKIHEITNYNRGLRDFLQGADDCHNIDRILRLPGTMNLPDARKRERGRVPVMAQVEEIDMNRVYSLDQFTQVDDASSVPDPQIEISGNIPRLASFDDLPDKVPQHIKELILDGVIANDPEKYAGDRSKALFAVVCALVRCGVSNEMIYGIITDDRWAISASVLDKGRGTERYALRQIKQAQTSAVSSDLARMNEEFAVIQNFGGKCMIIQEAYDYETDSETLLKYTYRSFSEANANLYFEYTDDEGEVKKVPMAKWWFENPDRRQYQQMLFSPGRQVEGAYNMWQGFAYSATPGDKHQMFLDHIKEHLCCGDETNYKYLVGWMASSVQKLSEPAYSAVVLRGEQGTGKGTMAKTIGKLFGNHFLQVSDAEHVVGKHNAHLQTTRLLFADEAFYAGDKKHVGTLKRLITEERLPVEPKFHELINTRNHIYLIMASNEEWVVPAEMGDRRFFILDVSDDMANDREYYNKLYRDLDNGGYENLLHYLLTYDLRDFNIRSVPKTEGLKEQKLLSMPPEQEWWYEKLREGRLNDRHDKWGPTFIKDELLDDLTYFLDVGKHRRGLGPRQVSKFLSKMTGDRIKARQIGKTEEYLDRRGNFQSRNRPYIYDIPSLAYCRRIWDSLMSTTTDWPEPISVPDSVDE